MSRVAFSFWAFFFSAAAHFSAFSCATSSGERLFLPFVTAPGCLEALEDHVVTP